MSQQIGRILSVVLGVVGVCCLAIAAGLFAMWVMDGGGYRAAWPEGLASLVLGACGAAILLLGRALRRLADQASAVAPTRTS